MFVYQYEISPPEFVRKKQKLQYNNSSIRKNYARDPSLHSSIQVFGTRAYILRRGSHYVLSIIVLESL